LRCSFALSLRCSCALSFFSVGAAPIAAANCPDAYPAGVARYNFRVNKLEAFGYIVAQAARGDITFPTSVNAVLRLQQALDDPDCPLDEAIRLVLA